ncbi:MAG: serine hydrolase [Bacteroidia bacterium]|nr:serine hydrolase [Bacteroidia bacterium]
MVRSVLIILLVTFLTAFFWSCKTAIKEDDQLLDNLMQRDASQFKRILDNKDSFEVQIIYTQINRDTNNYPHFSSFYYNVDSTNYFYPASTVKLPLVLLSLEKLRELNINGLDKYTPMFHDSVYSGQLTSTNDSTSENGLASVSHYAKKIMIVSDNDAFNRLYEFVGQEQTNKKLIDKGYGMRILHRLERPLSPDQNRHTEAVRFIRNDSLIFSQPMLVNRDSIQAPSSVLKGTGYMKSDSLVEKPFDFTYKNFYSLTDQQKLLRSLLFPETVEPSLRFDLSEEDRQFVLKYMSQLPTETLFPAYKKDTAYYDAYCKFLMFGDNKTEIPSGIRIFNKVGDAYGYLIDNAYIVDFEKGVEFMLSAVINTNTDGIYNDNRYEYKTLGYPFMKNLGQLIYNYELKRKRAVPPDLSDFVFEYDH